VLEIFRDYRRAASTLVDVVSGVAHLHNIAFTCLACPEAGIRVRADVSVRRPRRTRDRERWSRGYVRETPHPWNKQDTSRRVPTQAWRAAIDGNGDPREGAQVAELTA
jgi:hypothetical protein